ncbi:unnamed protein product, partial [marine sediment metagenome]
YGGHYLTENTGAGTITNAQGMNATVATSAGTIGTAFGMHLSVNVTGTGAITGNAYGMWIDNIGAANGTEFAIYTGTGANRFGDYMTIDQASSTGAHPVLLLDQGDVSEQAIKISYSAADVDMILIELNVTGAPKFGWSETPDIFSLNTP